MIPTLSSPAEDVGRRPLQEPHLTAAESAGGYYLPEFGALMWLSEFDCLTRSRRSQKRVTGSEPFSRLANEVEQFRSQFQHEDRKPGVPARIEYCGAPGLNGQRKGLCETCGKQEMGAHCTGDKKDGAYHRVSANIREFRVADMANAGAFAAPHCRTYPAHWP